MSVATEIERLQKAKSDLKEAINAKLSSNLISDESISDYYTFVENIETGSGEDIDNIALAKIIDTANVFLNGGQMASDSAYTDVESAVQEYGIITFGLQNGLPTFPDFPQEETPIEQDGDTLTINNAQAEQLEDVLTLI